MIRRVLVLVLAGGSDDTIAFEGVFDRARRSDPRCTASILRI